MWWNIVESGVKLHKPSGIYQLNQWRSSRGHGRMVVGLWVRIPLGEEYSIQYYVIKFVSDLRQVGGFLWVLWFPPPINWPPW
jgi:hypothetical protein